MNVLVLANVVALAASLLWLAKLALPSTQAVRLRNAFLLRRGRPEDFAWTPSGVPDKFRLDGDAVHHAIAQAIAAEKVGELQTDWLRAVALVAILLRNAREGNPIRADLSQTFEGIVAGNGYCADHVRVYMVAAASVGLFCRQWAFSFDGFGGHGHTVVEMWDRQRGAWALLDVHNNVYPVLRGSEPPLDAATLRAALIENPASVEFRRLSDARLGFVHPDKLAQYYQRGADEWYLWYGNDIVSRERARWVQMLSSISGELSHRIVSMCGRLPPIVVVVTSRNEVTVARMETLRERARVATVAVVMLTLLLLVQVVMRYA